MTSSIKKKRKKSTKPLGRRALINTYTREELEDIVKASDSYSEMAIRAGYTAPNSNNIKACKRRVREFKISTRHFYSKLKDKRYKGVSDDYIFCEKSKAAHTTTRQRYFDRGFKPYVCEICGMEPFWQGQPLTLMMDHINGIRNDNRLENLRWVCPNCNQQLWTTGFKGYVYDPKTGVKKKRKAKKKRITGKRKRSQQKSQSKKDLKIKYGITRIRLKNMLRIRTFSDIGDEYGVSPSAVVKWCKVLGLPYKKSEIKMYSDSEWKEV